MLCPTYCNLSISPSSEYSGLIPFRIDWFDLSAVQGTLKSLLQHHNSKASILQHSVFFMVQLSHPYTTTGKTIALTIRTFVSKVMSLLCSILSTFVIGFLPRSKYLLILWLHSQTIIEEKLPNALEGKLQIDFPSSSTQWSPFDTKIGQVPVVLVSTQTLWSIILQNLA